jgi:hypothetical protein
MKKIIKKLMFFFLVGITISACKKDISTGKGGGSVTSEEYAFNRATKTFDLGDEVKSEVLANQGIRFIYCYLIRTNATDSLIYVTNNTENNPKNYSLSIPLTSFPLNNMANVKGVKVMVKQGDNSSLEGFINISYFDPALPQFANFPTEITADINGGITNIAGKVTSAYGLKQVDIYDDYQTENTYVLVNSETNLNNATQYDLNYDYTYRKAAQHIKIVATDIYNQINELILDMPVDVSIFKPKFLDFSSSIVPNLTGTTALTGNITSATGLKQVDIYDDYNGTDVLVGSLTSLNGVKTYNFNYDYPYRKRAEHIKLVAIDTEDLQTEYIINLDVTYLSKVYRDVFMTAHTTGTNTIFIDADGSTRGNCELNESEAEMAFLYYGTSSGPSFYSPTNTGNVSKNFKCNGVSWEIGNTAVLRATRFRVLVPGTSTVDDIYAKFNNNDLDDLESALSGQSIGGSGAKFDPTANPTTSLFNTTTAYLIAVKIPDIGAATFKYGLIHIKEATSSGGTSELKFDIYIQK